jgi:hypothetical protein
VHQVVVLVVRTQAVMDLLAVLAAVQEVNTIQSMDPAVQDLQQELVELDHKVVTDLADIQE